MANKQAASTQKHISIAQIRDSILVMKDGTFRSVLAVSAVNFALKSEQEQNAIIYGFQGFVNGLATPIQIVVQSRQLDLNGYIQDLSEKAQNQSNDLLRFQMLDYIDFISRLITLANIMEKRFFIVVPHDTVKVGSSGLLDIFLGGRKTTPHYTQSQFAKFQTELNDRVGVITGSLASMGLRAAQLNTQELVEFYYGLYNPEEASEEKLVDIDALRSAIIHRTPEGGPHA